MTLTEPSPTSRRNAALGAAGTALLWVGLRLVMLALFLGKEMHARGDVGYYFSKVTALPAVGLDRTLTEYPTPVVWLLQLPRLLGARDGDSYLVVFMVLMALLDAGLTAWLWWRDRGARSRSGAASYWMFFTFLVGPLLYLRFDIVPAVLAAAALLLLTRVPAVSGGLVALGAAIKLWPALLVAGLFGRRDKRAGVWWGFGATGVVLVAASLLAGGWDRLVSPLAWQGERGLQIESVWATPTMVNVLAHPGRYYIQLSPFQAYEIFGPGVGVMLVVASAATVVGGLAIIALAVKAWRSRGHDLATAAMTMTAIVAVMVVTNKTFSPQYLVWLAGPLSVLVLTGAKRTRTVQERAMLVLALALALLTHLVYPLYYGWVTDAGPGQGRTTMTLVLAARNVGMLAFTVMAFGQAWSMLGAFRGRERDSIA
ncbi:Protein of unknown function [Raineyella antarctica]|uniref:DUF2029 domain-containing protein n=1 Tax=Raineyella antarctica TaxID=1577474 RepID=A0A1G6GUP9_9ACTN|nr:glycosyltransferase family 87 protein [Raineyella antarctica]SDB85709.1 Protein of unknown function [Raineyella antarctica]